MNSRALLPRMSYVFPMQHGAPPPSLEWCLFLDVDGTLLEIAATPSSVAVDEPLKTLLAAVALRLHGAIALVSGRSIAMLDALFAPLQLPAAGQHGAERRNASGVLFAADSPQATSKGDLEHARARLHAFVQTHPGTLLEDKGRTVAVHFRLAPELEGMVRREVAAAAAPLVPQYEVQEGKMVLEIKSSRFNKATAAAAFMREPPFMGRTPVFVGDDLTDEPGLRFAEQAGGLSIAVGSIVNGQWRLENPHQVRQWLAAIAAFGDAQSRN